MCLFLRGIPYFVRRFWGIRLFGVGLGFLARIVRLEEFFVVSAVLVIDALVDGFMVGV